MDALVGGESKSKNAKEQKNWADPHCAFWPFRVFSGKYTPTKTARGYNGLLRCHNMQIKLYYKNLPKTLVSDLLVEDLKACRFSVSDAANDCWEIVRFWGQKSCWQVVNQIESHVLASLYMPTARMRAAPRLYEFFQRVIANQEIPVREGILDSWVNDEVVFFSFEKFRNEMPPLSITEMEDGECTVRQPGDHDYWQDGPKLHFVSNEVLTEPGVPSPEIWAQRIRAEMHRKANGVVYDCGWSEWCRKKSLELRP